MDHIGVYRVHGRFEEYGNSEFEWDSEGRVVVKRLYADDDKDDLIYERRFFWNEDGSLNRWEMVMTTTGEKIIKRFNWNSDATIQRAVTTG